VRAEDGQVEIGPAGGGAPLVVFVPVPAAARRRSTSRAS
jgi:hypothetical protein